MSHFLPIDDSEGNEIYLEVIPTENQSGIRQTSKGSLAEQLSPSEFKKMLRQAVMPACSSFVDIWQELNQPLTAESAEVEFDIGFTASGSAVIMQASGQASFKVKVTWKFEPKATEEVSDSEVLDKLLENNLSALGKKVMDALKIAKESESPNAEKIELLTKIQNQAKRLSF